MLELIRPDWPAPPQVQAWCTTRRGGVSTAPYDSLNLGTHVGDDPQAVATNRQRLAESIQPLALAHLHQVHGAQVVAAHQLSSPTTADAAWTDQTGVACVIGVADCLPVLIADRQGRVVGAAHAGWRGLAGGVVDALVLQINSAVGQSNRAQAATELIAWLGPCIGPDAFEVGADVWAAFCAADEQAQAAFVPQAAADSGPKWLANLPLLARQRLQRLGVADVYGNDGSSPWCTVRNPLRFFSHRRDRVSGRMLAGIGLR